MRITKTLFLIILFASVRSFAATELISFDAYPVVDHCRLEWSTGHEDHLSTIAVERSADGTHFMAITQMPAKGSYSNYEYIDSSPLDVSMDMTFYYRLKLINSDGSFRYSEIRDVSLTFSAIQHTWGTIKAMFR